MSIQHQQKLEKLAFEAKQSGYIYYAQLIKQLFCIGEPIHIRSRGSFAVMKIQAPIIWQDFPLKQNTELPNAAAVLKWRLILRLADNVGISDHFPNHLQTIVWSQKTKKA